MSDVELSSGSGVLRLGGDGELWEQQEGEADGHFAVFLRYLELPRPRPLKRLVDEGLVSWSVGHVRRVAAENLWDERAVAFDADASSRLLVKREVARLRAFDERIDFLEEMTGVALGALRAKDPAEFRPRELIELVKVLFVAQDNLLGLPQAGGSYASASASIGVDVSASVGVSGDVIDGQLAEVMAEIEARRSRSGGGV